MKNNSIIPLKKLLTRYFVFDKILNVPLERKLSLNDRSLKTE